MSNLAGIIETMDDIRKSFRIYRDDMKIYSDAMAAIKWRILFANQFAKITVESNEMLGLFAAANRKINDMTGPTLDRLKQEHSSTEATKRVRGELAHLYEDLETLENTVKQARGYQEALRMHSDSLAKLIDILKNEQR